jgi:hypothetical protein
MILDAQAIMLNVILVTLMERKVVLSHKLDYWKILLCVINSLRYSNTLFLKNKLKLNRISLLASNRMDAKIAMDQTLAILITVPISWHVMYNAFIKMVDTLLVSVAQLLYCHAILLPLLNRF